MLPSRKEFHPSLFTTNIVSRFPEWMKIRQPDSVGFRFVDAIVGNELELFNNTLDVYKSYFSIARSPVDSLENLYQLELSSLFSSTTIDTATGDKVYVIENSHEFLTNPPTIS